MREPMITAHFTPFGYLQNPYYQSDQSYTDIQGALLRSDDAYPGFGWFFPSIKRCEWSLTVGLGAVWNGVPIFSREDWLGHGYGSDHHTCQLFSLFFPLSGSRAKQSCFQVSEHMLGIHLERPIELLDIHNLQWFWIVRLSNKGTNTIEIQQADDFQGMEAHPFPYANSQLAKGFISLAGLDTSEAWVFGSSIESLKALNQIVSPGIRCLPKQDLLIACPISSDDQVLWGTIQVKPICTGSKGHETESFLTESRPERLQEVLEDKFRQDAAFEKQVPALTGDWQSAIKNGWWYDFDTTRMCVYPPMGVFKDLWPSWMIFYPRAVLAEGIMDMNRMGYADLDMAKRAILSVFRDTGAENAPCVFFSGTHNMVAEDGSVCGTSPAWCMPFHQLYQLYLRDMDQKWLGELYPYLKAYHRWWTQNRVDEKRYIVYCCTWEAGEDDSPRLDPNRTGKGIISDHTRPVELQASMAMNAHIMSFFCEEIGISEDAHYWEAQKKEYQSKLQSLWDPDQQRFRDWDKHLDSWLEVKGVEDYWQADFTRLSPLSLIAVFFDLCTDEQREAMKREILLFGRSPFNVWPSWNYVVMEAAIHLGLHRFASEFAWEIIQRVYHENDRREMTPDTLPLPGSAREYWPIDLKQFRGNDAYAWGAQTALLLIRQIMGFRSSEDTSKIEWILCPSVPGDLMKAGKRYKISQLPYRGIRIGIEYHVLEEADIEVLIDTQQPSRLQIIAKNGLVIYESQGALTHECVLENYTEYTIRCQMASSQS